MKWKLWGWSSGGVIEQAPTERFDFTVKFRVVPKPHGKWGLQRSRVELIRASLNPYRVWDDIAEYASVAEAEADLVHLFGTVPIELTAQPVQKTDHEPPSTA